MPCYQWAYASAKNGFDNVYLTATCPSFGESKVTRNAATTVRYRGISINPGGSMVSAEVETLGSGGTLGLAGIEHWNTERIEFRRVEFSADIDGDGAPDYENPFSLTWIERVIPVFAAQDSALGRIVVRMDFGLRDRRVIAQSRVFPNSDGRAVIGRVVGYPRSYMDRGVEMADRGYDMVLFSVKRNETERYALYTSDLHRRPTDELTPVFDPTLGITNPDDLQPAISPDGRQLLFSKVDDGGRRRVYQAGLSYHDEGVTYREGARSGAAARLLADAPREIVAGSQPCWTHDGQAFLYQDESGAVHLQRLSDHYDWTVMEAGTNVPHHIACSPAPPRVWMATELSASAHDLREEPRYEVVPMIEAVYEVLPMR